MKIIACYIRVSSPDENQAKQRRQINRWLISQRISPKNVRWYIDKPSGDARRQKFDALQADILDGIVRAVVVWRLDRLSDRSREGLNVLIDWCDKSLRVVSVSQQIDIKARDCRIIASVLHGVVDMDKEARRERTKVGLAAALARGRVGGRPKVTADDAKVQKAKKLEQDGKLSVGDICKRLKISRTTYFRYLDL
jgi:DNA invertase Pin-like site-specific DNA recombinase